MQVIRYTAADRKKFRTWEWQGRGDGGVRALKMLRPTCLQCQKGRDTAPMWWAACTHEPYWSLQPKVVKTPVYEEEPDEDGDIVLKGTDVRTKLVKIPNITEVVVSIRSNDGRGPEKFGAQKGFITLPQGGLAPMCQMLTCGKAWPSIRTDEWGDYCSERHAKLCAADALEIKFTINDPRIQRQEMADINV